jgi:hypothetical protein
MEMLCHALLAMAIACAAALPLCALLLVLAVMLLLCHACADAVLLCNLLFYMLLTLLALAIVALAMPVLAILARSLLCAFVHVTMLVRHSNVFISVAMA